MAKGGDTQPLGIDWSDDVELSCGQADIKEFVRESNHIEGIDRDPTLAEIGEHIRFIQLDQPTVEDLEQFVSVYQPGKKLRTLPGMDVRVGNHIAPRGGPDIRPRLQRILDASAATRMTTDYHLGAEIAYRTHVAYETLHPFMDGNGRSGRVLWAWCMRGKTPLGFLHNWYYQTLAYGKGLLPEPAPEVSGEVKP